MPNYFYDMPEELQEMIYKEEHMMKMKEVTREVKKLTPFTRYLLLYNWQFHENVLPNLGHLVATFSGLYTARISEW